MIRISRVLLGLGLVTLLGCERGGGAAEVVAPQSTPTTATPEPIPVAELSNGPGEAQATPPKLSPKERALELAQRFIIVDGHVDLPDRLMEGKAKDGSLTEDVTVRTAKGDFDFERARAGGLDAPFMSIYVPSDYQKTGGAKRYADGLIDIVEGLAKRAPDKFALAKSVADVQSIAASKRVALPMGIENGAAIEKNLANVKHFYERGVRYITLTHGKDNAICDSSYDKAHTHKGLSKFGEKVVAEMNRVGIMVDVAHVSDDTFFDVMALTKVPVIASHSSCRHFTPGFERNMSDDMIKKLAQNGGVIMINFGSGFLTAAAGEWSSKMWPARGAWMKQNNVKRGDPQGDEWEKEYRAKDPLPYATLADVVAHIDHVIQLVGIDHVGLGSDFDGVGDSLPVGLKDPSELPNLIAALLEHGLDEAAIEKICSGNVLRVWKAVEDYAAAAATPAAPATPPTPAAR